MANLNTILIDTNTQKDKTGKYVGLKVVFSGTTGKELIEEMGATKMSSVSKKTDLNALTKGFF